MSQNYTIEFKKKIDRLHEEEGRTYKSITAEYGVSKSAISKWCSEFRKECQTSPQAKVHKYMNTELGLHSIVRPKKPGTKPRKPHKVFGDKLDQGFHADRPNQKWCTDFTYLSLKNGDVQYNCTILDPHDRSVVAGITDRRITSDLAVRTLQKALDS